MYNYAATGAPNPASFTNVASSPYGPPAPPASPPASADMNMNSQPPQQGQQNSYAYGGLTTPGSYGHLYHHDPVHAHGGRTMSSTHRPGNMVSAHFNPHELDLLDHYQGKKMIDRRSGQRIYPHLEEIIKNPHMRESIHHHYKNHLATGGHVDKENAMKLQHMAANGRYGDTEIAKIGPHTHNLLNYMAGGVTRNPHDGHPEYWSLSGALGSLGNALKSGYQAAKPALMNTARAALPMVAQHIGQKLGGDMGGQFGSMLGGVGSNMMGPQEENLTPYQRALQTGLTHTTGNLLQGKGLKESIGHGIREGATDASDSPVGAAIAQFGHNLSQGRGIMDSAKSGARYGFQQAGGRNAVVPTAAHIMGGIGQEGGVGARISQVGQRLLPNSQQMAQRQSQYAPQSRQQQYGGGEDEYEGGYGGGGHGGGYGGHHGGYEEESQPQAHYGNQHQYGGEENDYGQEPQYEAPQRQRFSQRGYNPRQSSYYDENPYG